MLLAYILIAVGLITAFLGLRWWLTSRPNRYHRRVQGQSRRAHQRLQTLSPGAIIAYLRKMNPHAVEEIILDAAAAAGHPIRRNKAYTGDGGIDGQIMIDGVWHLVQTKRYAKNINPKHVADFSELCAQRRQPGLFVHCGRTGKKSRSNASEQVRFISGQAIVDLILGKPLGMGETTAQALRPAA